jgi:peptidoglycan pentaglycine glycine transferase (the first glycine)
MTVDYRPVTPRELDAWDDLTVHPFGGHVLQSRAWAEHRARFGWRPYFLVGDDGSAVLALIRPWPVIGGASAYLPRGPIPAGGTDAMIARLDGVVRWLSARGVDVVASDAEIPAATGYRDGLATIGFRSIEEIQPSRHRMTIPLGQGASPEAVRAGFDKATRQRIRRAESDGTVVVRWDRPSGTAAGSGGGDDPGPGLVRSDEPPGAALDRFYNLLLETGDRRHFTFGPRGAFVPWWRVALEAGLLVLLEARTADGETLAGLVLYRHGGRLSTAHSADHAAGRTDHPGVLHLLRWRAIELAIREGCAEMDLGGVDVRGARRIPEPGEPMRGLYDHKRGFGATWVELAGAHERVIRPWRYALGRGTAAISRAVATRRRR